MTLSCSFIKRLGMTSEGGRKEEGRKELLQGWKKEQWRSADKVHENAETICASTQKGLECEFGGREDKEEEKQWNKTQKEEGNANVKHEDRKRRLGGIRWGVYMYRSSSTLSSSRRRFHAGALAKTPDSLRRGRRPISMYNGALLCVVHFASSRRAIDAERSLWGALQGALRVPRVCGSHHPRPLPRDDLPCQSQRVYSKY